MPKSLWPNFLNITKKKKCMFGKDEEPEHTWPYYTDTGNWITTSATDDSGAVWTTGVWIHAPLEHDEGGGQ